MPANPWESSIFCGWAAGNLPPILPRTMPTLDSPALRPVFQPDDGGQIRALVVAGACGNVGFGKLGQFARLLAPRGIPVFAVDPSPQVAAIASRLDEALGDRFSAADRAVITAGITPIQGGIAELPAEVRIGFVFEAIPERLALKHALYEQIHARDPDAWIASATSGFPTTQLFGHLPGKARCAVMHPFFPHLTNKLFEVPVAGATTGKAEMGVLRKLLGSLGMTVVAVADVPAFAADRIFCGMMLEAVRIHAELGLSPAQIDDACKRSLGTSPFYVHNMIPGANYLSAHCMELCKAEVDSSLYAIPDAWRPYIDDAHKKWPYEKGASCPPERRSEVEQRMLGMLFALTARMADRDIAGLDTLNYLCENALAMREGVPALIERLGHGRAQEILDGFLRGQRITVAEEVAPRAALGADRPGWGRVYVQTAVHDGVGLLSIKRTSLSDTFLAEIAAAKASLEDDPAVRAIVIAPDGHFSREFGHGADLQAFVPVLGDEAAALALIERWKATTSLFRRGKPTVAALVGRVLGGSLELAAACHARIAAVGARLQFPETTVGVVPGLGGCHMVHRQSRPEAAAEIDRALLTGAGVTAEQAHAWGFVSEIVAVGELPSASMALARRLADGTVELPWRASGRSHPVATDVPGTNEAKVPLSAGLRALLVETISAANGADAETGGMIEARNAARSLAGAAAKIGVTAMLRGKPPVFDDPLG